MEFIQKELEPYTKEIHYIPGMGDIAIELHLTKSEYSVNNNGKIWVLKDISFEKGDVVLESSAFTVLSLRKEIRNLLLIPCRNIRFRSSHHIGNEDLIILSELNNVRETIEDHFICNTVEGLDELGHHYEFCDVEDYEVTEMSVDEGFLVAKGSFSISVVLYLDSEEEIKEDVSLDGIFDFIMNCDGKTWEATDVNIQLVTQQF